MRVTGTALHWKMQQIFEKVLSENSTTKLEFWRDDEEGHKDMIVVTTKDLVETCSLMSAGIQIKLVPYSDRITVYINPDERLQDSLHSVG